jgi:hypothetical protein
MGTILAYSVRPDGREHVEIVDRREGNISWIVERVAELKYEHNPLAIAFDAAGPCRSLQKGLAEYDILPPQEDDDPEYGDLAIPTFAQLVDACGLFADAVATGRVVHRGQIELDAAIRSAETRPMPGGAWAWARRSPTMDITPVVGSTVARWAYWERLHLARDEGDPVVFGA